MTTRSTSLRVFLLGLLVALVPAMAFSQNVTFTPIGPATARSIIPRDVSSNGKVVIGDVELEDGLMHPFMWDSGVFTLLADSATEGMATGISADGSTVALTLFDPSVGYIPYRWTATDGLQPLPLFPYTSNSLMTGRISKDGSTIIGNGVFGYRVGAVKWTSVGIEEIAGAFFARDVSRDGSVIVGDRSLIMGPVVDPNSPTTEAFRWTSAGGLVGLGSLDGDSSGWLVSGDGNVVMGNYGWDQYYYWIPKLLFRWTEISGLQAFPSKGAYSVPTAISFDGSIVLSTTSDREDLPPKEALIWTPMDGLNSLSDYLWGRGVQSPDLYRWRLIEARAMSPWGRFIAGYGVNPNRLQQMFIVDLGPLPPPVIASPSSASAIFDSPFSYTITASNDPDSLWAFGLPPGLSINGANGVISGRPFSAGTFEISLGASNSAGYDLRILTLEVNKATAAVTISNTTQAYTGTPKSVSIDTTPEGLATIVTYAGASTLPIAPGTYQVNAVINDPNYQGSAIGSLTVTPPPAPVITSPTAASATYNSFFSYTIAATNNPKSFDASPLPGGLSLDKNTGVISGQPSAAGTFVINLTATNPGGDGIAVLTLQVGKGTAGVAISNTSQVYTGTPRDVSIVTTPAGLSTVVTYNGASAAPSTPGTYQVSATIADTNYQGSATATMNIFTSTLQILTQPANVTVVEGAPASFTVIASGPGSLSYKWRRGSSPNAPVIGTDTTLTIASTTLADAGTYKVTVSNGVSTITSASAKLVVTSNSPVVAPTITQQPMSQTVTVTNSKKPVAVTFTVAATGTTPLNYQWRKNGVDVPTATANTLTISKVALSDSGAQYQVYIWNAAGSALSNAATLTVN